MNGWSIFVRQATALCLLLAVALAVVMLTVAHQVQGLEEELGSLRRKAMTEQQTTRVLQAEFSFLAEPERLRRLAGAHLGLVPVEPDQLASFATLDDALQVPAADAVGAPSGSAVHLARGGARNGPPPRQLAARERAAQTRSVERSR
jgi:cell division protein FtsL